MKVWMIRAGRHGEQEPLAIDKGLAVIGWPEVPDLTQIKSREQMRELCRQIYPNASEAKTSNLVGQLFSFAQRIDIGDIVAIPKKTTSTIALGRIIGPYRYREDLGEVHHTRTVDWIRTDVPRTDFSQDLLYSLGAIMTVCRIERNNAEQRFQQILNGAKDPELNDSVIAGETVRSEEGLSEKEAQRDVEQLAKDQIVSRIETNYKGHDLARLVEAILKAEGYQTELHP